MILEVEGTRPWDPRGKGSLSISKGPKPPIQLLQLLKNSPREVKRAHFRYILGPTRSHPGDGITGARRGRSLPAHTGFSSHAAGSATDETFHIISLIKKTSSAIIDLVFSLVNLADSKLVC